MINEGYMVEKLLVLQADLQSTNSGNDKKEILKKFYKLDKELYETIFSYIYDYDKVYGISYDNCIKYSDKEINHNLTILELLDKLTNRELTGHEAIGYCNNIINWSDCKARALKIFLDKDLKAGTGVSTINKVHKCVKEFNVALGESLKNCDNVELNDNWFISRKIDGCLHKDTKIETDEGIFTIQEVVENNKGNFVKSYNESNDEVEFKKIVNRFKNNKDVNENNYEWYEIETFDGKKLKLTGNHRVYLPNLDVYRRVDELAEDDVFLVN